MARPEAILIAGPTASGKSALALRLARALGGAVINADAMQVYRELKVLSARPGAEEEAGAPHLLYGFASAFENFSVARWLEAAEGALDECRVRGLVPVFAGGTGLYFAALLKGLSPIPEIPAAIRAEARRLLADMGNARFHAMLGVRDPVMGARLPAGDSQRLVRAFEVIEATGQSLAEWQTIKGKPSLEGRLARLVLKPDRALLNARIAARFERMVAEGALEEVRALEGLDSELPAARALGVAQLRAHLEGRLTLAEAVEQAVAATRQYAKRQSTWFRHQMPDWNVIAANNIEEAAAAAERLLD